MTVHLQYLLFDRQANNQKYRAISPSFIQCERLLESYMLPAEMVKTLSPSGEVARYTDMAVSQDQRHYTIHQQNNTSSGCEPEKLGKRLHQGPDQMLYGAVPFIVFVYTYRYNRFCIRI